MDPLDSYRAANLLIQQHGKDAKTYAVQRLRAMREVGDECGERAWIGVFDALLVLEAMTPPEEAPMH